MKNRITLCIICLFISSNTLAAFAKVIAVKGKVSQLGPGMTHPKWLKKGDLLKEDTSLVTRRRSFVKVRVLNDGSFVTLGAKSKLVLTKINKKEGSIISMLNGSMRSKVVKNKKKRKKNKIYIKTRTAALGVRGTEFVVAVNQENQVTSLVTLEGEVAMNKIDTVTAETNSIQAVQEAVDSEQVTLVRKGRAATSYVHKEDVTVPTKVNPNQLVALKQNKEMAVVKEADVKAAKEIKLTDELKKELYAPDTKEEIAKGLDAIPENGAIVDLNSAIFIPKVAKGVNIGAIDKATGTYKPLAGVKLDPRRGFLVADAKNKEARKLVAKMKKVVQYKSVPKDYAPSHTVGRSGPGEYFAKEKPFYELSTYLGLTDYGFSADSGNDSTNIAGLRLGIDFTYTRPTNSRLSAIYLLGVKAIGLNKEELEAENTDDLSEDNIGLKLALGYSYKLSSTFKIISKLHLEQDFFPAISMNESQDLNSLGLVSKSLMIPKIELSLLTNASQQVQIMTTYKSYFSNDNSDIILRLGKSVSIKTFYRFKNWKKSSLYLDIEKADFYYNDTFTSKASLLIGNNYRF